MLEFSEQSAAFIARRMGESTNENKKHCAYCPDFNGFIGWVVR
jgi:hypothetical protein